MRLGLTTITCNFLQFTKYGTPLQAGIFNVQFYATYAILKKNFCTLQFKDRGGYWEIVGSRGATAPRLEIVGKSDTLSVNLDQFLGKLS